MEDEILKVIFNVTSPLNKDIFYKNIKNILEDKIWNDLILNEKETIEITLLFKTKNKGE